MKNCPEKQGGKKESAVNLLKGVIDETYYPKKCVISTLFFQRWGIKTHRGVLRGKNVLPSLWRFLRSIHLNHQKRCVTYVWFISYSKCSNWRQILKLVSNIGCLFTFCYLDWANSIKTDLHICNLWTGQFVRVTCL